MDVLKWTFQVLRDKAGQKHDAWYFVHNTKVVHTHTCTLPTCTHALTHTLLNIQVPGHAKSTLHMHTQTK